MSFSQRQKIALRHRQGRRCTKRAQKKQSISYSVHWIFPTIFIVMLVFLTSIYLCQWAKIISVQYRVTQLKQKRVALQEEQKKIKLDIERLESLERIEKIAREDLKMNEPVHRIALDLDKSTNTALSEQLVAALTASQ